MKLFYSLFFFPVILLAQKPVAPLKITQLTGNYYIFTTYNEYKGSFVPANGMYVLTNEGAILFDTPWDKSQFSPLLDSIRNRHGKEVVFCLSTHFHADRTAGLDYYNGRGIRTFSSCLTLDWCKKEKEPQAAFCFEKDTTFHIGGLEFETFYPGHGHAPDNIVVWFPKEKILYGGCFIKSIEADNLGNLSDANPKAWLKSVKKVKRKFRKPRFIIPGHNAWEGDGLRHTTKLLEAYKANSND